MGAAGSCLRLPHLVRARVRAWGVCYTIVDLCTIVIPAYNPHADALAMTIARLLLMPQAERILVVDDGSHPPLSAHSGPLSAQRVTLIRQENAGVSEARNSGLEVAARFGKPVVLLDADDFPLSGLADALRMLENKGAAAVVSARVERDPIGNDRERPVPSEWAGNAISAPGDVFRPIALFGASGAVVHPRAIDAGVRFDPKLTHGEDRDFLRKAAELGPIAVNPVPALRVTLHPETAGNLTSKAHDAKRARSLAALAHRWADETSTHHFKASATWLTNRVARTGGSQEAWTTLMRMHKEQGWSVPLKARLRRLFNRPKG